MMMNWQAVIAVSTIVFALGAVLFGAIKMLLQQYQDSLDKRFETLESALERRSGDIDDVEGEVDGVSDELKEFKKDAAEDFVTHDTWVRVEGSQNVMLRNINANIEKLTELVD